METPGDRFRVVREQLGLSKVEFARSLDIPPSLESVIESGQRRASLDVLYKLDAVHKVNLNWFISGNEDTRIPSQSLSDSVRIPLVLQEAAAGKGVDIEDYSETKTIMVPRSLVSGCKAASLRAVMVRGDSMIEKEIYDKDTVIINIKDTQGESISVVSVAGQLLVKHVSYDAIRKTMTLTSANKMYQQRIITGTDLSDVKIEGRVVACLHGM